MLAEDGSVTLSKEQYEELQQGYNFIYDDHQCELLQKKQASARKLVYRYRYRRITVGNGDSFIFKHKMIERKGVLKPLGYSILIYRTSDRDEAILRTEALNIIEQLEEVM